MSFDHNKLYITNMNSKKIIKWSGSKTYLKPYVDDFIEDALKRGDLKEPFSYLFFFWLWSSILFILKKNTILRPLI